MPTRPAYPTDCSDDEGAFAAPYLALVRQDAPQRKHDLRQMFDAVRWIARAGAPWRLIPHDFPPWHAVYEQARRWIKAGVFERMAHDLRALLRVLAERKPEPTAAILDSRTIQSTPTSGGRAGYDGAKRKEGSKVHAAVDTLGHLLALAVTPANEQDRAQVGQLAEAVQRVTGESVTLAWVDQGYTGEDARKAASEHGIELAVVTRPEGSRRLRALASAGGGGAELRVSSAVPSAGAGLRASAGDAGGAALRGVCVPDVAAGGSAPRLRSLTSSIAPTVWAFDCERVPDADAGRHLLALDPDTPEPDVFEAMWTAAGASPEQPRPFLKLLHCRLASVAVVERRVCASGSAGSEVVLHLCALPRAPEDAEADILTAFFDGLARRRPQLVGFNSHGADLMILAQRGLVLGLAAPGLCRRPDRPWEGPDYFHAYNDWNVDLMRAVGGRGAACPSLRDLAVLSGIPAKMHGDGPCSGGDVADLWLAGDREAIRRYNECDALTTYLLWLRTARFAGLFTPTEHAEEEGRVEALLERRAETGADHLGAFLERWRCLSD